MSLRKCENVAHEVVVVPNCYEQHIGTSVENTTVGDVFNLNFLV